MEFSIYIPRLHLGMGSICQSVRSLRDKMCESLPWSFRAQSKRLVRSCILEKQVCIVDHQEDVSRTGLAMSFMIMTMSLTSANSL